MQNDPTQSTTHPIATNHPANKEEINDNKDNKNTGLPKKDDEEHVEDESRPEDFEKFNVDKVGELEKSKDEGKDIE